MDALGKTARGAFLRGESAGNTGQNDRAQTLESAEGKGDLTASRALPRGAAEKAGTFRKSQRAPQGSIQSDTALSDERRAGGGPPDPP
jgi:hypothetical protein